MWEGAQPHLSRRGPWGGVSHLCWSPVRFLTSPRGQGAEQMGPGQLGVTAQPVACLPGFLTDRKNLRGGGGAAGSITAPAGGEAGGAPSGPSPLLTQAPVWWETGATS